jgi:cytochrome c553
MANEKRPINHLAFAAFIVALIGPIGVAWAAGDAEAGKAAATKCVMCHGRNGEGTKMGSKLAGEDPTQFIQAMDDYKSGKRDNVVMKTLATQLNATDTADLAAYYASLK